MISGIAFLKSIATFKTENAGDFTIISDCYWGSEQVNVYIKYENSGAILDITIKEKSDLDPSQLGAMESYLEPKFDELTKAL